MSSPSRSIAKQALAVAAVRLGGLSAWRSAAPRRSGPRVHVFGYHRVVEDVGCAIGSMPTLCISTRALAAHLDYLADRFCVLPLESAADVLSGRAPAAPRDVAAITFDDNYRGVLELAAPLLAARRLPATLFVTTGLLETRRPHLHDRLFALIGRARSHGLRLLALGGPHRAAWPLARADEALAMGDELAATDAILLGLPRADAERVADRLAARLGEPNGLPTCLGWDDLSHLGALGFAIGAHTVTHANLPLESDEGLRRELAGSRDQIARTCGVAPAAVAYPAGRFDDRVVAAARAAGFVVAVTTEDRTNRGGDDVMRLGRRVLSEAHTRGASGLPSPALVAAQLDGLFASLRRSYVAGDRIAAEPWRS